MLCFRPLAGTILFLLCGAEALGFATQADATTETVLYNFTNGHAWEPTTNLLLSNGVLFGSVRSAPLFCCGEVFELLQSGGSWTFHSVYGFGQGKHDGGGRSPSDGLVQDASGVLYGTTFAGGIHHRGTIFQLERSEPSWTTDFIWNFTKKKRGGGSYPGGHLIMDANGSLYGEAGGGTHGHGVVYALTPSGGSWTETVLHNFKGNRDGSYPWGGLLMDAPGSLWGTTTGGGGSCACGTVFHLIQSGGVWTESVVHRFGRGSDGAEPVGSLVEDDRGNLFGTTEGGGEYDHGTVFEISPKSGGWKEAILYSFCPTKESCADGAVPEAGLSWGADYNTLYGATGGGGNQSCGCGTVFALTDSGGLWSESVIYSFRGGSDGSGPAGGVTVDASGNLFGTTVYGGIDNGGTVWEITP